MFLSEIYLNAVAQANWENKIHRVVGKLGDGPVYRIHADTGDQILHVLHCNLLLPVNNLPLEHETKDCQAQKKQTGKPSHKVSDS